METVNSLASEHQQIQTLTANGSTIQYVTDGNPEQAAVAVLQAVFGTTAPLLPASSAGNVSSNAPGVSDISQSNTAGGGMMSNQNQTGTEYFYESLLSNGVGSNMAPSPTSPQAALSLATTTGSMSQSSLPTQIVAQSGNTFLVQSNNIDAESAPITHTTRASPITVSWTC